MVENRNGIQEYLDVGVTLRLLKPLGRIVVIGRGANNPKRAILGSPRPHLESHPRVNLDHQVHFSGGPLVLEVPGGVAVERDVFGRKEQGEVSDVPHRLVEGGGPRGERDLLVAEVELRLHARVGDGDPLVGVVGFEGEVEVGGEAVVGGEVEVVDGAVFDEVNGAVRADC
nr:hypothetical protein Itr_chr08CG18110 [Ipomoea trifida]